MIKVQVKLFVVLFYLSDNIKQFILSTHTNAFHTNVQPTRQPFLGFPFLIKQLCIPLEKLGLYRL